MAGIKCAHEIIMNRANTKVTILEAGDYIGGRMKKISFADDTFEAGANWVSGL